MKLKHFVAVMILFVFFSIAGAALYLFYLSSNLPQMISLKDYKPLVVSNVFDANGEKIGEFYRERRIVVPYEAMPEKLVRAFVAAEDDEFFEHSGINYFAIARAALANLKAGKKSAGSFDDHATGRAITLVNSRKTYTRKIKEILLSYKMESNLSKGDIIYLYLNQIYFGEGAYGVAAAAQVYFRKDLKDMKLSEMAVLAGLPQAPSRYSPLDNPTAAKARQKYVLGRMQTVGFITQKEHDEALNEPIVVFARQNIHGIAPFFVETIRQQLVKTLGENKVLDEGLKIETGLVKKLQIAAQERVIDGLRALDKRQGFRGPKKNLSEPQQVAEVLLNTRNKLMDEASPELVIQPDGSVPARGPLNLNSPTEQKAGAKAKNLPEYAKVGKIVDAVVTKVDDKWSLATVRFAENQGLIDLDTMRWARKPNPEIAAANDELGKISNALKVGDLISVKIASDHFASPRIEEKLIALKKAQSPKGKAKPFERPKDLPDFASFVGLELEQDPIAEGALLSFDLKSQDILAMVGGFDFDKSEFNRAIQATRQTGSSFKPLVYAAALDNGTNPASVIIDAPVVYEDAFPPEEGEKKTDEEQSRSWKPGNYGKTFGGDVLLRNALISSLNIPTVKLLEDVTVSVVADYSRRLGIFSPLNLDLSLGLGSSSVTLYEMTKVFSHFARLGRRTTPLLVRKVRDQNGSVLVENISLDMRFEAEMTPIETALEERRLQLLSLPQAQPTATTPTVGAGQETSPELPAATKKKEPRIFFSDKDQLLSPQTAYLMTSLLKGVIFDPGGTGGAARSLGRPAAGKTGTTSNYFDTWFLGYTPQIVTGVWVGYDNEKSLGVGETGGRTALPVWTEYMKTAHEDLPRLDFPVPDKIVFANIDNETGKLASATSKVVVRQAFVEGTEPTSSGSEKFSAPGEDKDFLKEDLAE